MKNCPNCNLKFDDSVNFCNACGTALVAEETPVVAVAAPVVETKPNVLFAFLFKVLAVLSAMFGACGIASAYIDVSVYYSSYTSNFNGYGYFEIDPTCAVFALLLALGTVGLAVLSFIQGLIKKAGKEALFENIFKLVLSTALLIFSIVLLANI